jgi:hypothetical protein
MTVRFVHASWLLVALLVLPVVPATAGALGVPLLDLAAVAAETNAAPHAEQRGWQTGLLRTDRLQHASLALTSGLMIGVTTEEPAWAAAGAMTLGLAKEIIDIGDTGFDVTDLVADLIGAVGAAFATSAVTR